jgi:prepilin-type N-terminal cleavage/methylation domain-containing protein
MSEKRQKNPSRGFTLIEILVALVITSILTMAIYSFFIGQHHAYTVQDQVIEMEQNARAAMDMIRRELRMAGYHAMGDDLINNLSDFVPSSFIPTYPVTVNLDANPKISEGSGTEPDVITFLSVVPTNNNPTALSTAVSAGGNQIALDLTATQTGDQYNVGDMIHIGTTSEYATVTAISGNTLTIDTNPGDSSSSQGLARGYAAGTPIGEIYVVSYAVFNEHNDPSFARHDPGHPVLKRKVNGAGFMPVAENITDMQLFHTGSGEIQLTLSSRTDRADHKFQSNGGYRAYTTNARVKVRNADTVAVGTTCAEPDAPESLALTGLDDTYPCKIHITWDAVTGTTGCEVFRYIVYYGTTPGAYAHSIDVGNVTAYTLDVTALKACTYYVAVAAVNSAGTGPKSAEQSITDTQGPAVPTGFSAENINGVERKVALSWDMNTECDLQGYNMFGRSDSLSGPAPQINTTTISKAFTNYSDTNFTPIDCATYHYSMEAVDFCPNSSGTTTEVSVSPTAPAPPTGPVFSTTGTTDTISWILSADDFEVNTMNYIVGYRVYDPIGTLLTTLNPGTDTWTSASLNDYYDVSATDACGNESAALRISSACSQSPVISIDNPAGGTTVSGTINIDGTAAAPSERTIAMVRLKIDDDPWITILNSSIWEFEWDTTKVTNGNHTLTVRAIDSEGCYSEQSITVNVSNSPSVTPQVFCTLFVCKKSGNNQIYLVVYVYDHEGEPVADASVGANILFGSGAGSKDIPAIVTSPGYYGGEDAADCTLYSNDLDAQIPPSGHAIKSKSKYKDDEIPIIEINVTKESFLGSTCIITPTAE